MSKYYWDRSEEELRRVQQQRAEGCEFARPHPARVLTHVASPARPGWRSLGNGKYQRARKRGEA